MDKNTRICIIGGGPAGLSAGMYLEKKGYENHTILEKSGRVGGKCWSPYFNGRRYEMGAIMGVPSYYAVHDVEEFCGITHDGPKLNRNYKNKDGKVIEPFEPKKNILKIPRLLKMKKQLKQFGELLETKYKGYDVNGHRGVAQGRYDGFAVTPGREPVSGENENLKDLALPFSEFCKKNGVELVQDIWIDQVITTYALRKHKNKELIPYEDCNKTVLDDLKVMGNPAKEVVNKWTVYYFPHVFSEDYAAGWYDKVEAMQGKDNTYYAGEIMSFGDMDETAEYSRELVERFF